MPHLAKALREASLKTSAVELLDEEPYPTGISESRLLRLIVCNGTYLRVDVLPGDHVLDHNHMFLFGPIPKQFT